MERVLKPMAMSPEREYSFTQADFRKIRTLIYQHAGITLAESKSDLVYSRISRRIRALNLRSFAEYVNLLAPGHAEWQMFTNALTTNLTAFFREQHHFPILAQQVRDIRRRPIQIWSAAASTGEEPYSIAITVADVFGKLAAPVRILASDVDTQVLDAGRAGVYPLERVEKIPEELKRKYFHKGSGEREGYCKVVPELQSLVTFRQLNLLDKDWHIEQRFDAIFCRNVMIYFDKPTQRRLIERFVHQLQPGGLFFAGHSESFFHAADLLKPLGKTVYRAASQAGPESRPSMADDAAATATNAIHQPKAARNAQAADEEWNEL